MANRLVVAFKHVGDAVFVVLLSVVLLCLSTGCALPTGILRSRWAMDDPEYAEKYAKGAKKSDVLGKLKQAADARFMADASGMFVSGGVTQRTNNDEGMLALDIGGEHYLSSYLTGRASLMGMANSDDWFTGVDTGLRLQTPTRLAPFVGLGAYAGFASEEVLADDDGKDNDDDGRIDEYREQDEVFSGAFAALYPEVGTHFWWTPGVRLTGFGRYMVSTEGRDSDDWMIGIGVAFFNNPFTPSPKIDTLQIEPVEVP
ncbi:hypothetical protein [Stieleria varia]|uniref:Outer membrane protein beta-barrel domain-containing protein n=1 Tax=Stieleria varia TaxID=2528005 RepID=A0A5C6A2Z7_9BACT|nr:hypothetical protein [Stieleria varia]TWT93919.1 hypothetical protein Pla52n_57470 [Stieleria varia]